MDKIKHKKKTLALLERNKLLPYDMKITKKKQDVLHPAFNIL